MASDPLSSTTHKARTYLLALSTAGFLSSWYNLKVRDIPFSGVDTTVDEKLVPIMLTVGISYFLVSFVIYAVDDIINQAYTPYQERIRSAFTQLTDIVRDDALKSIEGTLTSTGTAAIDAKATTAEIWARCFPLLKLDIDAFREQVTLILGNEFEIPPTEKSSLPPSMRTIEQVRNRSEDMSGYVGSEIFDSLELAWYGWTYHRKQIFRQTPTIRLVSPNSCRVVRLGTAPLGRRRCTHSHVATPASVLRLNKPPLKAIPPTWSGCANGTEEAA